MPTKTLEELSELIDTAFRKIDENRLRARKAEVKADEALRMSVEANRGYIEIVGLLKEHKAKVEGIIDSYERTLKNIEENLRIKFENYKLDIKVSITEQSNKIIIWLIGSMFTLFGLIIAYLRFLN